MTLVCYISTQAIELGDRTEPLKLDVVGLLEQTTAPRDVPAHRLKLEADVVVLVRQMSDRELATWLRLGHALRASS